MAKKIFSKRTLAIVLTMVMLFNVIQFGAFAAGANGVSDDTGRWTYAYYLGQEYLGNAGGKPVKPDPVGYGFQGVITSLTFQDDAGTSWTFVWSSEANGEWRITGSRVSKESAGAWPQVTDGKQYIGYCGNKAYKFTLSNDGSSKSWTYLGTQNNPNHANWFRYIRFIREYTVNVFYQNETGSVVYNGVTYAAQEPLVRDFQFLYPNGNIIDDSEYEDGEYTDPVTLLPKDYLTAAMIAQGYEIKYATDANGEDVLANGVTISLLGDNVLNVYCTLIPPKTEEYTVIHRYYTEGSLTGSVDGGSVEVPEGAHFADVVKNIEKRTRYDGNTYAYISYRVDPNQKVIELTYTRTLPVYDYTLTYNANFGANETRADTENIFGSKDTSHSMTVDSNPFLRENYTFVGWNTRPDGKGVSYAAGTGITLTAADNTKVLYAIWQENPKYGYSLTYDANFGAGQTKADAENVTGTYAETHNITVDGNTFVRENHTFVGWNTSPDGKGQFVDVGSTVALTAQNNTEVLYAIWQENPKYGYSLTYNANFGANETKADEQNISETYATEYGIEVDQNDFVRPNYSFVEWNTQPDGKGASYAAGEMVALTAQNNTEVLYAIWQENPKYDYTLIYNANFGANETKADTENAAGTYATAHSITVDGNPFVRENYTFVGWNTQPDGKGQFVDVGSTVALTAQNNTEVLYAIWQENPKYDYEVLYNANFGDNEVKADAENVTDIYAEAHNITVDGNPFVRENYTFVGWNTSPDGKGQFVDVGSTVALTAQNNTEVLYAIWQENPKYDYEVLYNANFGDNEVKADDQNLFGTYVDSYDIGVDSNSFVRENYTFAGWSDAPDGKVVFQSGDSIHFEGSGSKVLYAVWVEDDKYSYTVIYNGNGGVLTDGGNAYGDAQNITGTYAASHDVTVDENGFIRENYTFTGWNTMADGSGRTYTAEEVIVLTAQDNTRTLYAQWAEDPKYDYSVIYNANFGDSPAVKADAENASGIYETVLNITVDDNAFARQNYTFTGWNTQADGSGKAYTAGEVIALTAQDNTEVLYAQWTINMHAYNVRYMVRVNSDPYAPFAGVLPTGAPTGEETAIGTVISKEYLDVRGLPASLSDDVYTYSYTAIDGITVSGDGNVVTVYYSCTVEPITEPEPTEPEPTEPEVEIPDDDVPLADLPKTGDPVALYAGMAVLSGAGLVLLKGRKKEDEE